MDTHDILIVDDSATVAGMFADLLTGNGYRTRTAQDGRAALEQIAERRPDLILLDVMMPEMDGYEVCRRVRAQDGEYVPILMITAPGDLTKSFDQGADDFISKPPDQAELNARVRSLLRIRDLQKRLYEQHRVTQAQNRQLQDQNQQLETISRELQSRNQRLRKTAAQLKVLNRELEKLSVTDSLTKAYNHQHFHERLRSQFSLAKRHREALSCVMVDIDRFKQVNDTYGHLVGDRTLVRLAEILKQEIRVEDFVARYGGEEFGLILPKTAADQARQVAERLRTRVEGETLELADGVTLTFTISLGVAEYRPDGLIENALDLVAEADKALYRAKTSGRNRVEVAETKCGRFVKISRETAEANTLGPPGTRAKGSTGRSEPC